MGWGGKQVQERGDVCILRADAGRDWEQEEKGMTEGEMAGWHH